MDTARKVGIDYFHGNKHLNYFDGDILILKNLDTFQDRESLKIEMVLIVICRKGELLADFNGEQIKVRSRDMLICPPSVFIDNLHTSPDFDAVIFGLSYQKFLKTAGAGTEIWTLLLYASKHPVFHLSGIDMSLVDGYFTIVWKNLQMPRKVYFEEIMHSIIEAIFYEICVVISREMKPVEMNTEGRQAGYIFRQFINLVAANGGKERSVNHYATELCITPKYLSAVTKAVSGKPALSWILSYTTVGISHELKYSGKSIKEIANDFNFPTISSFGKFFKKRTGMSPKEYRATKGYTAD